MAFVVIFSVNANLHGVVGGNANHTFLAEYSF